LHSELLIRRQKEEAKIYGILGLADRIRKPETKDRAEEEGQQAEHCETPFDFMLPSDGHDTLDLRSQHFERLLIQWRLPSHSLARGMI
jgi:hypothetical protein